jgi:multidrug efflux pump subunit AcrA (membrane-fusion protein)
MLKKQIIIILASILLLSGCKKEETKVPVLQEPVGVDMDTAVVTLGDIYHLDTFDAKVYPELQEVSFLLDGALKEFHVNLGDKVKKGALLATLDDQYKIEELKQLEGQLQDAKKNNEYEIRKQNIDIQILELTMKEKKKEQVAEIEVAKMKSDLDKLKLVKEQTIEEQQFHINVLQKKIDDIKKELEEYNIVAPYDGDVVYMKSLNDNKWLTAYSTVAIIANHKKLHIQSDVIPESVIKDASRIYALINGKEYDITYQPLNAEDMSLVKDLGGNIESIFTIDDQAHINPGDYACVCIKGQLKENVLIIPQKALYNDVDGNFVYRMVDGNQERCNVEIGTKTDIQVEIISGLKEGDIVYVQE